MYTLHCTQKLIERIKQPVIALPPAPTTSLGNWYAHSLFWTSQVALLVNERTLLPVLMSLAPAATLPMRFPAHLAIVLRELGINAQFVASEIEAMSEAAIADAGGR